MNLIKQPLKMLKKLLIKNTPTILAIIFGVYIACILEDCDLTIKQKIYILTIGILFWIEIMLITGFIIYNYF